jgi:large subunit ribosomal protein L28
MEESMSRVCEICSKGIQFGNRRSHANNASRRVWQPNLQRVRAVVEGRAQHLRVCTSCLRSGRVTKNPRLPKGEPTPTES